MSCALYRMAPPRLTSARKKTNIAPTREREKIERICYIMTRGTKELEHGIWWLLSLSTQRERLVWGSSEASRCRVINRGGDYIKARSPLSVYLHFLAQRQTGKRHYTIWDDDDVHRPFSLSLSLSIQLVLFMVRRAQSISAVDDPPLQLLFRDCAGRLDTVYCY